VIRLVVTAIIAVAVGYLLAMYQGQTSCAVRSSAVVVKSAQAELGRVADVLQRGEVVSTAVEKKRATVQSHFYKLDQEAIHDAPNEVDNCVLPAERLQRWRDANSGATTDIPSVQSDASASDAAAAGQWTNVGLGSESSTGSKSVPPAGDTNVRPADVAEN